MNCKTCGTGNPEEAKVCGVCGGKMGEDQSENQATAAKICACALWSMAVAILVPFGFFLAYLHANDMESHGGVLLIMVYLLLASPFLSSCLGFLGLYHIKNQNGALAGRGYAYTGITISVGLLSFGIILPALARVRSTPFRMSCGTNLSGMGKAMLIYANDHDNKLPKAGAEVNAWTDSLGGNGNADAWLTDERRAAYGIDQDNQTKGKVTASANLYVLLKHAEVTPKSFVCPDDQKASEFRLSEWLPQGRTKELVDVWDFGYFASETKNQTKHVSYSYHHPFGNYTLDVAHAPDTPVAADRNPWLDPEIDRQQRWFEFTPDLDLYTGTLEQARRGNSEAHKGEGQNVLFLDSHVSFKKRPYFGIENDNIYTVQDSEDKTSNIKGRIPVPFNTETSAPRHRRDSVLVQENGKRGR